MILRKYWKPCIFTLVAVFPSGCSTTVFLVPLEGPLIQQHPVPTLHATANGIMGNTGDMSLTMPDGESCVGKWSSAAGADIRVGTGSLIGPDGSVYSVGTSLSTGTGQNPRQVFLICSQGRTIQMEFITEAGTIANGSGFAKDNKGNVYRVLF